MRRSLSPLGLLWQPKEPVGALAHEVARGRVVAVRVVAVGRVGRVAVGRVGRVAVAWGRVGRVAVAWGRVAVAWGRVGRVGRVAVAWGRVGRVPFAWRVVHYWVK